MGQSINGFSLHLLSADKKYYNFRFARAARRDGYLLYRIPNLANGALELWMRITRYFFFLAFEHCARYFSRGESYSKNWKCKVIRIFGARLVKNINARTRVSNTVYFFRTKNQYFFNVSLLNIIGDQLNYSSRRILCSRLVQSSAYMDKNRWYRCK